MPLSDRFSISEFICLMTVYSNSNRKLLLPTSSEEFKILEEGPLRVSVEVDITVIASLSSLCMSTTVYYAEKRSPKQEKKNVVFGLEIG